MKKTTVTIKDSVPNMKKTVRMRKPYEKPAPKKNVKRPIYT